MTGLVVEPGPGAGVDVWDGEGLHVATVVNTGGSWLRVDWAGQRPIPARATWTQLRAVADDLGGWITLKETK